MRAVATLADIEATEAIPLAERHLPNSTYQAIGNTAKQYPDYQALAFFLQATEYQKSVSWTYKEFFEAITQTANMFHDLGVGKDDTVAYITGNTPQTYFTLFGAEAAGIAAPINPLLEPHVLAEIMTAANTKVLVTFAPFPRSNLWEQCASIANDVPTLETILTIDLANYLSGIKKWLVKAMRLRNPKPNLRARILDFDKTMAKYPKDRLVSGRKFASSDTASYFHTGGTTGTPKLARHTHANEVFDGWAAGIVLGENAGKQFLLGLPLFHNFGAIAMGINVFSHGAGIVMATPSGYRGEGMFPNFWKILEHYRIGGFGGVPTVFQELLNVPIAGEDLSQLEMANSGAAPLPVEMANQFEKLAGIKILEGYGLTESTSVASVNPFGGESRIGSVGLRLPYTEMAVAELEGDSFVRFCDVGEVGTVVVRGPNVFPGYLDDFHNQGTFIDTGDGGDRWLNTGDLGRVDTEGYFWLTGRQKELIIRGGHNIDPKQIEEPLHRHPAVALAAAVGKPDPRVGEMPVAYVELKPDTTATSAEILEFAKEHIGERAAVPKEIHVVDAIPLTAVGKIFKPALTRGLVKEVYEAELSQLDGIASATVTVEGDKRLGTLAHVMVTAADGTNKTALEDVIRSKLGQYTVAFNLEVK